jgi:cysteine desulfurase/selenocysteine lyase
LEKQMDVAKIRKDFPILERKVNGKRLVYLDSACQTLRPKQVVDALTRYYNEFPACAGRSVHSLATSVSIEVDAARERMAEFVNASRREEICFTKNCTEALNTVLFGLGLRKGDAVITSDREHNSMHVPLLTLRGDAGIRYERIPSRADGSFDLDLFSQTLRKTRAKLVAMCHTSNVNGTTLDAKEIARIAHEEGAVVLFDGAQYAPCGGVDLKRIDADFYAFSCHKMCGPSGVGVLTGKYESLSKLRPLYYGGHGVSSVSGVKAELMPAPERFEAGLQNYAGIIGAGVAADYVRSIGREEISAHIANLNAAASAGLDKCGKVEILEPRDPAMRGGILGFNVKGFNPHDVAMMLDHSDSVMIRSGMHCAHTWFEDRGMANGSARASFYIYNDREDADGFVAAVGRMIGK